MSIEYLENHSVYKCTLCNKLTVIDIDEQPPEKCEFCDNLDPWLYENAIVELIHVKHERETVRYTGQEIKTEYCVRGTPWEMLPLCVKEIWVSAGGTITAYGEGGYKYDFFWVACPSSIKAKKGIVLSYKRPEWTKYLPGMEE